MWFRIPRYSDYKLTFIFIKNYKNQSAFTQGSACNWIGMVLLYGADNPPQHPHGPVGRAWKVTLKVTCSSNFSPAQVTLHGACKGPAGCSPLGQQGSTLSHWEEAAWPPPNEKVCHRAPSWLEGSQGCCTGGEAGINSLSEN